MQSAKSIMLKSLRLCSKTFFPLLLISLSVSAQDNSPYSRYGLGDAFPNSSITTRSMGGIAAGYTDFFSINYSNPASYSQFLTSQEQRSKKVSAGRVVLDIGMNFDNRTLVAPNTPNHFTSADAFFSYLQLGIPIRKNWGLSFGLRPVTRISYLISRTESLKDPVTGNFIDTAVTQFSGNGGAYLPTIGTGFGFNLGSKSVISAGFNVGYLFGRRETKTLRSLIDTFLFYSSDHSTTSSFGGVSVNGGLQFTDTLTKNKNGSRTILRLGLSGNLQQSINGSQDVLRQTFSRGTAGEELQIDSVYSQKNISGKIIYPASYKAGFVLQRINSDGSGWLFGSDYSQSKWSNYRFFGQVDSVQDSWQINVGGEIFPRPQSNYFSRVAYRFGFFRGRDYIKVQNNLPLFGITFGMGLPIHSNSPLSRNQFSLFNVGFEYSKRGNNSNLLKENMFRISIGFNFTDLWFGKKKYE